MKNIIISILIIFLGNSCIGIYRNKNTLDFPQDLNFQKCQILAILNECYVLVKVKDKMYVSKLAGISFDNSEFHPSWTKEQIRKLKICLLDEKLRWRSENYHLFLLDVSSKENYTEIILVCHNLNGYYNFNKLMLLLGASFDYNYKAPYHESMFNNYNESKQEKYVLFGEIDIEFYEITVPKDFNLDDFPEKIPDIVGEWIPTEKQLKEIKIKGVKSSD